MQIKFIRIIFVFFFLTPILADSETQKTYIISIGINSYPLPYGNLKYAASDAEKFASIMQRQGFGGADKKEGQASYKNVTEVILLSDTNISNNFPSRENILKHLNRVLTQMTENDFLVIFFSGHGTGESLVTTTRDNKVEKIELKEILYSLDLKAEQYMLFLDACRYTENRYDKFTTTMQPGNGDFKSIFYSTSKDGFSQESAKLEQGVYGHYLLKGLQGEADTNSNSLISSDELRNYVSENVRLFTDERQIPQLYQFSTGVKNISFIPKDHTWKNLGQSAIIPGYGQWEKGHKTNSIFFFSSFFLGGFYLYNRNIAYERAENAYYLGQNLLLLSSPTSLDNTDLLLFQATENNRLELVKEARSFNLGINLFALLYLWNLWDAGIGKNQWFDSNKPQIKVDGRTYKSNFGDQEQRLQISTEWRF